MIIISGRLSFKIGEIKKFSKYSQTKVITEYQTTISEYVQEILCTKEEAPQSQNIKQNKFLKKNKPKSARKELTMSNPAT